MAHRMRTNEQLNVFRNQQFEANLRQLQMGAGLTGAMQAQQGLAQQQINPFNQLPGWHDHCGKYIPDPGIPINKPAFDIKPKKQEKKSMFGYTKEYFEKHKETVMTVSVVLLIDHFFLHGALRERIRSLLEGILKSAEQRLGIPFTAPASTTKADPNA